jgi:AcrR family transcriptional regulator
MPKSRGIRAFKADETRAALVRAGRKLFAEQGFHATGTSEIAALAGVTRGALQHHFPRKEDLFLAVFKQVQEDMLPPPEPTDPLPAGAKWTALKGNLDAFLDLATKAEVQRIVLIDGPAVLGWSEWRKLEAHYGLGVIMLAVEDGIAAGLIRAQQSGPLAHLILALIDEAALLVANAPAPHLAKTAAGEAVRTLLRSLA